jgi:hypothetical protein
MLSQCCELMADNLAQSCEQHPNKYDCPDALVDVVRGGYGLIIHDGSKSVIEIRYCPWCGARLPEIEPLNLP